MQFLNDHATLCLFRAFCSLNAPEFARQRNRIAPSLIHGRFLVAFPRHPLQGADHASGYPSHGSAGVFR